MHGRATPRAIATIPGINRSPEAGQVRALPPRPDADGGRRGGGSERASQPIAPTSTTTALRSLLNGSFGRANRGWQQPDSP